MIYRYIIACVLLTVLLTGCGEKEVKDLPIARAELTARLLDSLNYKRYDEALGIIDKLLALYPDDVELMEMKTRVITNRCTDRVQECIDQGKLEEALAILQAEQKKYPMIRKFIQLEDQVRKLITLRDSAEKLAAAKEIPALEEAIKQMESILKDYPQAASLHLDLKVRKMNLQNLYRARQRAEALARQRAEAAAKAKAAAAKAKAQAEARAKAAAEAQARADAAKAKAEEERKNNSGNQFVGPQRPQ